MNGIIYKFTNNINGKIYIGQTTRPKSRYKEHCTGKEDSLLTRAMLKYGIENFKYEVLETIDKEQLNTREKYWINYYNSYKTGYNQTTGGNQNIKFSQEARKKMSESKKGRQISEETRKKMSEAQKGKNTWIKGRHHSEETRKKISEARKGEKHPLFGKHHSEETRKKISETKRKNNIHLDKLNY